MNSSLIPLEVLIRRIVNDRQIFDYGESQRFLLIAEAEMPLFRGWIDSDEGIPEAEKFLREKLQNIAKARKEAESNKNQRGSRDWSNFERFTKSLLNPDLKHYVNHLRRVCSILEDFGDLQCCLPAMDQYGQVVEVGPRAIVDQFFAYKIDRAHRREKAALQRLREHLAWGYEMGISFLHLGFVVRKSESLTVLTEVGK